MKEVSLGRCGAVFIDDDLGNGPRSRIAREFTRRLITGMCRKSVRFFDAGKEDYPFRDYPLRWNELTFGSSMAAVLDELTPEHLSEAFVERIRFQSEEQNNAPESNSGRTDFWCRYRNCEFLIETKRSAFAWRRRDATKHLNENWSVLTNQLLDQKADSIKWRTNPVRLGLMPVFTYQTFSGDQVNKGLANPKNYCDEAIKEELVRLQRGLKKKPKLWAFWRLPKKMRLIDISDDETQFEYTPAIFFLGRLEIYDGRIS